MSRLAATFAQLQGEKRAALVPYVTAGDPQPDWTVDIMHTLVENGADIIELGVPFSDPMADGPVIQAACERALAHKVSLRNVLEMVSQFRRQDDKTPIILMGYLNPVEVMGYERFAQDASEAGVDGVILVDLPPEEAEDFLQPAAQFGIDPVFLLSPTSTPQRIKLIASKGRGFLYYVSLKGVTGVKELDVAAVSAKVAELKQATDLPIGVGFGIKDDKTARAVGEFADAVVVGSAIVKLMEQQQADLAKLKSTVGQFLATLRDAVN